MAFFSRTRNTKDRRLDLPAATPLTWVPGNGADLLTTATIGEVRGLPAAWYCLNLISNGVATMSPLQVFAGDDITKITPTPPVIARPLASMQVYDFWHMAVSTAIMHGNFVALLADYDQAGFPQQTVPVPPSYVSCYLDGAGYTVYVIQGETYSAEEVVHVRGMTVPGSPWGVGVVSNFRRSLGQSLDQQLLAADTYRSGSVPSGIIKLDRPEVDKDQAEAVQAQWIAGHGAGLRRPAVLPRTMDFVPISWSPEDSQFLQARQFNVAETALMFGLNPSDLGANIGGQSQTYANIEDRQISRVTESYGPWLRRFEEAFSDLIAGDRHARFNVEELLRTDSKTRAEVHEINIATGVETLDEARAIEHKKPAPKPEPEPDPMDPNEPTEPTEPPTPAFPMTPAGTEMAVTQPKVKV